MATFYRPVKMKGHFGAVLFDEKGDEVNIADRGLTGDCAEGNKHDWLLLPKQEGQKQYLYCMKCGEHSHT